MPVPDGDPVPDVTKMSIGMARLGSSKGRARCLWRTFDMSAVGGVHYVAVPPTEVVFEDGETHVDARVEVIPCDSFDGTVELGLYIEQDSGRGCAIGKYLHTATLKIIDTSAFPTDDLREWVKDGVRERVRAVEPGRAAPARHRRLPAALPERRGRVDQGRQAAAHRGEGGVGRRQPRPREDQGQEGGWCNGQHPRSCLSWSRFDSGVPL